MPTILIRSTPTKDVYALWDTRVDGFTHVGSMAEFATMLVLENDSVYLERARDEGCSAPRAGWTFRERAQKPDGSWWLHGALVLPFATFEAYCDAIVADGDFEAALDEYAQADSD